MPTPSSKPQKPLRYILIDTNIFTNLNNRQLNEQITYLLHDSFTKGYGFGISQFSIFELLDAASVENENKAMSLISGLKHFHITQGVLKAAAHLGCLYTEDDLDIKKQPEIGDKIIAASAILNNAVIFTLNGRDFPIPFFKEISRSLLNYKKPDGRDVYVTSYFLEPDFDTILKKYNSRIGVKVEQPPATEDPKVVPKN